MGMDIAFPIPFRKVINLCIEHVIGQLKKFLKLLEGVVPISMLNEKTPTDTTYIDFILTVGAALCNLSPSVVPFTHTPLEPTHPHI